MSAKNNKGLKKSTVAENRRARFDYFLESQIECGIALVGSEVKALRSGKVSISESYATVESSELWLINSYFPSYEKTGIFGHEERRNRKLLVKKRELSRLWYRLSRDGMTLVPLKIFFSEKGLAKVLIGIAKGKKLADKREVQKKRDWNKQRARLLRERG